MARQANSAARDCLALHVIACRGLPGLAPWQNWIKHKAILLTINSDLVVSEPGQVKDKGISMQLSNIAENLVENMIAGKEIQ